MLPQQWRLISRSVLPVEAMSLLKHCGLENLRGDDIGVHVGCRAAVFEVAATILFSCGGDAHGGPTITDTIAELVDRSSLMQTREPPLISSAIHTDVLLVLLA